MAARAYCELICAVNAGMDGVIPDPPVEEINFSTANVLEIDLEYSRILHVRDDDYTLAPDMIKIKTEMISEKHH